MPEYLAPGVFVEEVSFRPSQIQPASTSVAAIVGPTRFGPIRGTPQLLTSFNDYTAIFGDASNLSFGGTSVVNYTAYSARAFFDNGGQQLYLARIVSDVANLGSSTAATAALAVPATGTTLVTFEARFPGAAGNLNLVFAPRRSQRLLQLAAPAPADTVLLRLSSVAQAALVGPAASLTAASFPLQSLVAAATLVAASGTQPAQYNFVAGQPVIYVDQSGVTHASMPTSTVFATGVLAGAVTAGQALTPSLRAFAGIGQAPMYSIPVGPTMRLVFSSLSAATTTLYGTISGSTFTLPKAINPDFSADQSVPLAMFAMGARTGDGNIYHDSYDISVNSGALAIYSFPDVDLEQDAARSLAVVMAQTPSTGSAVAMQPVYAVYTGTISVTALWAAMLAQFNSAALHPTDPAVAPRYMLTLAGGTDGTSSPQLADYAGAVDEINGSYGLAAFEGVDQISMVLAPAAAADSSVHQAVISAIQAHCTKMLYRVGIIESPQGAAVADVEQFAGQFADTRLAFYYPWISVASLAATGGNLLLPPSGFMAGMYAYTDITRGVYKAPANEVVQDALGLELYVNTAQQQILNPLGINCIRSFPTRGILCWGARTLSSDPQWQYVNVRRYFLYLEHSIADSTSWVVFEPNGQALWSAVATTVSDFLYNEWFNGRLFGATPAEAYFVRCDRTTITEADLENGRLICLIGVAPLEPAEFVIFRIGQWTASA
jgi:phage tail sheath protein FI